MKIMLFVFVFMFVFLSGCVLYDDGDAGADDSVDVDVDASVSSDAAPSTPTTCRATRFVVSFSDGMGECPADQGIIPVVIDEDVIVSSQVPAVDGTAVVTANDSTCHIDIYRAVPYGTSCAQLVRASFTGNDEGNDLSDGIATMEMYCWESNYTCGATYVAHRSSMEGAVP